METENYKKPRAAAPSDLVAPWYQAKSYSIVHADSLTEEHGRWFTRGGVYMTAIYHPAALLRDETKRPDTFVDLKIIQAKAREVCTHTQL